MDIEIDNLSADWIVRIASVNHHLQQECTIYSDHCKNSKRHESANKGGKGGLSFVGEHYSLRKQVEPSDRIMDLVSESSYQFDWPHSCNIYI